MNILISPQKIRGSCHIKCAYLRVLGMKSIENPVTLYFTCDSAPQRDRRRNPFTWNWSFSTGAELLALQCCLIPVLIYCVYLKEVGEWRILGSLTLIVVVSFWPRELNFSVMLFSFIPFCIVEMACFWQFGFIDKAISFCCSQELKFIAGLLTKKLGHWYFSDSES